MELAIMLRRALILSIQNLKSFFSPLISAFNKLIFTSFFAIQILLHYSLILQLILQLIPLCSILTLLLYCVFHLILSCLLLNVFHHLLILSFVYYFICHILLMKASHRCTISVYLNILGLEAYPFLSKLLMIKLILGN